MVDVAWIEGQKADKKVTVAGDAVVMKVRKWLECTLEELQTSSHSRTHHRCIEEHKMCYPHPTAAKRCNEEH